MTISQPARRLARFGDRSKYGKRHKPGEMNRTESEYANILETRKLTGEILGWEFESTTFKLAPDCRYTPDFCVMLSGGTIEFVDAKGGGPMDEKSRVKCKVAAEKFWWFQFVIEQKLPKKLGGGWKREVF